MAINHGLSARLRQDPVYVARLQKYCIRRWTRARTAERSARWFAAVDRCARLSRLAAR
jgi:hypothetical protein